MKHYLIYYFLLPFYLFAQKNDTHWIIAKRGNNNTLPMFGLVDIGFGVDSLSITKLYPNNIIMEETNTSISDTAGNLLFYTNGLTIFHAQHDTMQGSKDFNKGLWFYNGHDDRLPFRQSVMVLPHPTNDNLHYIFHKNPTIYVDNIFQCQFLQYSVVDMQQDSGRGAIIQKNVPIIQNDWICNGYMTACKHANGKDWWILSPKLLQNEYYTHLFTGDSIVSYGKQKIGLVGSNFQQGLAVFTPDGTKYIVGQQQINSITVFDFDRCTGLLSNPVYFTIQTPMNESIWGNIAVSPNSRYLYATCYHHVLQFDLWATDISASKQVVATYDGYICTYPNDNIQYGNALFFVPQLAPNGKIYISSFGATDVYTAINQPDSVGLACDVQQHALDFNKDVSYSIPNFPNYRLGASVTPCYGVDKEEGIGYKEIAVYPNPATTTLHISFGEKATLHIVNALGQEVYRESDFSGEKELSLEGFATGVYYVKAVTVKGQVFVAKFFKE